jgi:large subunit ribosomal protein L29
MIMKMTDIRKFKTDELATETTRLREEIAELRRRATLGELDNVRMVRAKRKDLARMLTVLGEQLTKENI